MRLAGMVRSLALAGLALVATACFDAPEPDCAFECGDDGACPDDYGCASDGWCKRIDLPDDHVCEAAAATVEVAPDPAASAAVEPAGQVALPTGR